MAATTRYFALYTYDVDGAQEIEQYKSKKEMLDTMNAWYEDIKADGGRVGKPLSRVYETDPGVTVLEVRNVNDDEKVRVALCSVPAPKVLKKELRITKFEKGVINDGTKTETLGTYNAARDMARIDGELWTFTEGGSEAQRKMEALVKRMCGKRWEAKIDTGASYFNDGNEHHHRVTIERSKDKVRIELVKVSNRSRGKAPSAKQKQDAEFTKAVQDATAFYGTLGLGPKTREYIESRPAQHRVNLHKLILKKGLDAADAKKLVMSSYRRHKNEVTKRVAA